MNDIPVLLKMFILRILVLLGSTVPVFANYNAHELNNVRPNNNIVEPFPNVLSLAGEWKFAIDSGDVGEKERWFNKKLKESINLPGITDEGGYGKAFIETNKLSRLVKYVGKAWYQLEIEIPKEWDEKYLGLFLERVMWKSKLWVDGKYIDTQESLSTPHKYPIGKLSPGIHTLTLCIDNREIYPIGNLWGHSYGDQTQIIWNGILGKVELNAYQEVAIQQIRTFSDAAGNLDMEFTLYNSSDRIQKVKLSVLMKEKHSGKTVKEVDFTFEVPTANNVVRKKIKIENPLLWDEFSPNLYTLETIVECNSKTDIYPPISFGFRTLDKTADYITVNGIPRFLRGNLDCALFPLTGYPPVDKESWLQIFRLYKDYGLNHVRFHSWTPPSAAFEAADEVGIYVLSEIFWRDGWMGKGLNVDSVEPFLRPELMRIADTYGNHPSLIALAMGNELGGFDINLMDPWIKEAKEHDCRHFYTVSVRRPATKSSDIDFQGDLSSPYPLLFIDEGRLRTDWDYAEWYGEASPLPSIQHEVGQWVFYPNWNEVDKYTGNLRAKGLEEYKSLAKQNGVYEQNSEFIESSGLQSIALYKENIESLLRTPLSGGFQLLGMQDFSGQGEALVGWLDAFYDSKGVVTPERFRNWSNTTVPLMRTASYLYSNHDSLKADIDIFHFATDDIERANIEWKLSNETGKIIDNGRFSEHTISNAMLNEIGHIEVPLNLISNPQKLILEVSIKGTSFKNEWDFWVFPKELEAPTLQRDVIETNSISEAVEGMKEGKTVFLWAYELGSNKSLGYAQWKPTFWRGSGFGNDGFVNGAVIRKDHRAFNLFPTDNFLNFQWYDICDNGRGFNLSGLPFSIRPIVQPIHDFHFNKKLGSIMEFSSEEGGRLLICGYNLIDNIDNRPAARALKNSLFQYVSSDEFKPVDIIDYEWMKKELQDITKQVLPPTEFEGAYLYVNAGGLWHENGEVEWSANKDATNLFKTDLYGYSVFCESIFVSEFLSAWQGRKIEIDFKLPFDYKGEIKVKLYNPESEIRKVSVWLNGKETDYRMAPFSEQLLTLPLEEGDSLLGKLGLVLNGLSSVFMVKEIAIMP